MRRVRAYSRDERKRLIICNFAEAIRTSQPAAWTCATIAQKMDITPQTKLRKILKEMVRGGILTLTKEHDAGIAGFREVYELNYRNKAFHAARASRKATRRQRIIRLNSANGYEEIALQ